MKHFVPLLLAFVLTLSFSSFALADWNKCKGCHNGKLAPDEKTLKEKYKTADELIKGAMSIKNPLMKSMQNETVLKEAAESLGLH